MKVSEHPLYQTWNGMVRRCRDPKNNNYKWYGALGIDVYQPWSIKGEWGTTETPQGFIDWLLYVEENLGDRPEGHSLDRIDSSGDYEPGNIRWSNITTQNLNRNSKRGRLRCIRQTPSGGWKVEINKNSKKIYLGTYQTIEEAIKVREEAT